MKFKTSIRDQLTSQEGSFAFRKSRYDLFRMDENVEKFMIASAAALSLDWPLRDGKTKRLRVAEVLDQAKHAGKRIRSRADGGNTIGARGNQSPCNCGSLK